MKKLTLLIIACPLCLSLISCSSPSTTKKTDNPTVGTFIEEADSTASITTENTDTETSDEAPDTNNPDNTTDSNINLTAVAGDASIIISWENIDSTTNYNLYYAKESGITPNNYTSLNGGEKKSNFISSQSVNDLENDVTYYLIVAQINTDGLEHVISASEVTATPKAIPNTPTNLAVTADEGKVTVTWDESENTEFYSIYLASTNDIKSDNYDTLKNGAQITQVTSPYVISHLKNDTEYYFIVTASNSSGESYASESVNIILEYLGNRYRDGDNFLANTFTDYDQEDPRVAMADSGNYVIVWQSYGHEVEFYKVNLYGQLFASDGSKIGSEFRINETIDHSFSGISYDVDMNSNGDFIVAWGAEIGESGKGVYARLYNSNGVATTLPFLVDNESDAWTSPQVTTAMNEDGSFIVAYQFEAGFTAGYKATIYDTNGNAGSPIWITDDGSWSRPKNARMESDSNGDFVVTWEVNDSDHEVYARAFSSDGTAKGISFIVNTTDDDQPQESPDIAMLNNGSYIIVWQSEMASSGNTQIFGQKFSADTSKDGEEFVISTYMDGSHTEPKVTVNESHYIVTWSGENLKSDYTEVFARAYDNTSNVAISESFRVNTSATDYRQQNPAVDINNDGSIIIAWTDGYAENNGIDNNGIYAQQLNLNADTTNKPHSKNFKTSYHY